MENLKAIHILTLLALTLCMVGCQKDESPISMDEVEHNAEFFKASNTLPGCIRLEFKSVSPGKDRLIIRGPYGFALVDTLLESKIFDFTKRLQPKTEYQLEVIGSQKYKGSFETGSVSNILNSDYRLQVRKKIAYSTGHQQTTVLHDDLVQVIKVTENELFVLWPQRQARTLFFDYSSCSTLGFKSEDQDKGTTILSYKFSSDSIFIRDVQEFDSGYRIEYLISGSAH